MSLSLKNLKQRLFKQYKTTSLTKKQKIPYQKPKDERGKVN